jgi:hypothetical protein
LIDLCMRDGFDCCNNIVTITKLWTLQVTSQSPQEEL